MSDEKSVTPEEAITGPRKPPGLSTVRPWTATVRLIPFVVALGGVGWFVTHPVQMPSVAAAGKIPGKVAGVDANDLMAHPAPATAKPKATPHPVVTLAAVVQNDVPGGALPAGGPAYAEGAVPPPEAPPPQPAPAYAAPQPRQPSAAEVAALKRADADRAALDAPLSQASAPATVAATITPVKVAADYDVSPPDGPFLAPGTLIDVTLYSSVQSGQPALLIGYVGRDVLDYFARVVVIPAHSKIIGHLAATVLQPGENRIGATWSSILLPNGHSISLNDAPGADLTGTAGFGAAIDSHTRKALVNVLAYSILTAGLQLAQPQQSGCFNCQPSVGQSIGQSVGAQVTNYASDAYHRSSQIAPTAHLVEGSQVAVLLTNFMPMRAWDAAQ